MTAPAIRPVLFDLDGVIVDSRDAIARSINHALEGHGIAPRPEADLYPVIGAPLHDVFADLLREAGKDETLSASCIARYRERYGEASLVETKAYEGMPELIEALAPHARLGVATTKPAEYACPILQAVGVLDLFEVVVGSPLHTHRSEGKATTIARALDSLGIRAPGTMVGDRRFDMEGGRANGLRTVGVLWGEGTRQELEAAGADVLVDRPAELLAALRVAPPTS